VVAFEQLIPGKETNMLRDGFGITGHFYLEVRDRHGEIISVVDEKNVILDVGTTGIAAAMRGGPGAGTPSTGRHFNAINLGDDGALASDPSIPKTVDPVTQIALFHELGTSSYGPLGRTAPSFGGFQAVQQGAPNEHHVECQQSFLSSDYANADFLDITKMYINEAMCFLGNPNAPTSDPVDGTAWVPFAMRTFKSVPFAPTDAITALIRWTFIFERA
jgi:hypothetical protein